MVPFLESGTVANSSKKLMVFVNSIPFHSCLQQGQQRPSRWISYISEISAQRPRDHRRIYIISRNLRLPPTSAQETLKRHEFCQDSTIKEIPTASKCIRFPLPGCFQRATIFGFECNARFSATMQVDHQTMVFVKTFKQKGWQAFGIPGQSLSTLISALREQGFYSAGSAGLLESSLSRTRRWWKCRSLRPALDWAGKWRI